MNLLFVVMFVLGSAFIGCDEYLERIFSKRCFRGRAHPTDETLIQHFEKNRESFELLRRMLEQDEVVEHLLLRDNEQLVVRGEFLPDERAKEYIALSKKLGLCMGFSSWEGGRTIEAAISQNSFFVLHGYIKGCLFSQDGIPHYFEERESLDGPLRRGYFFRPLGSDWYLIVEDY